MKKKMLLTGLVFGGFLAAASAQIPLSEERVVVSNERKVNSDELEFSPVFYKEGIVFISTRHESLIYDVKDTNIGGKNIMSIYRSERDEEGFLQVPVPLADELIFRYHEGPVSFDRTANVIFFTKNEGLEEAPDGYKKLQIYGAEKEGELWENIQKLPFNNINYNYCHPTISTDEDVLIVSSDIPGGYGGMDLYVVTQVDGKWVQMVNLGDKVNTTGNEVFPYLAADDILYFSSDGLSGFGDLDIFYSSENKETGEWRKPINLSPPFNTPTDDFGFIVDRDNKNGYFSSDRKGGFGGDDIYNFHIEGEGDVQLAALGNALDGLVILDENGNPITGAEVSAISFKDISLAAADGQIVSLVPGGNGPDDFTLAITSGGLGKNTLTNADGTADLALSPGSYVLKVAKEGYAPQYVLVTPDTDLSKLGITLQRAVDCVMLSGTVLREGTLIPVGGAVVKIINAETKEAITVYSDAAGFYEYCIDCNGIFSVYAEKSGVSTAPGVVSTKQMPCDEPNSKLDLPLYMGGSPLYAGMTIRLPNIYFNFDDAKLRPDAYPDLDEVVAILRSFPEMKLELASHTDARGNKDYNLDLSRRRSANVLKYLSTKGAPKGNLTTRGYGESQLRNRCADGVACTEGEHQLNRRTEVKILELGGATGPTVNVEEASPGGNGEAIALEGGGEIGEGKGGQDVNATEAPEKADNDATVEKTRKGSESVKTGKKTTKAASSYAVIAGTFASHDNAIRRAKELTGLGYFETSVVRQTRSGLYAVFVETFKEKNAASSLVKKLAKNQLHAYVLPQS